MANEKRLIDANALIKEMNAVDIHFWHDGDDGVEMCVNTVHNAPTVDAVEVVRCKDCKRCAVQHNHITLRYQLFCTHGKGYPEVSADDFCSYGERRDNERKAD